ncbi:MAG TPA: hypothetical protein VL326_35325 [Kofleriaceae bacterium]|jgi:hypothetical protein|nr:hypothetical protein [Kofleriaceae bacterium]
MKKLVLIFFLALASTAFADEPQVPDERMPPAEAADARKACTDAMNKDPDFARSIVSTVDKQIDQRSIDAHEFAARKIQRDDKHVIYAYAAMWLVAALFVAFLWMRLVSLKSEIAQLRKDLDDSAKDDDKDKKDKDK